ncbi:hypothetical protein FSOLCH5_002276 [Fusarium solani]|nr:hypothetical protein NW759_004174 [Fusarium solani]
MDPKPASTEADSASEENSLHLKDFSMLSRFIYDTSSFSDRLVQLAPVDITTEPTPVEDYEPASGLTDVYLTD